MNNARISLIDVLVLAAALNLVTFGFAPSVHAAAFATADYMAWQEHEQRVARVNAFLNEERVQAQLIALGVEPAAAQDRVASLTAAELAVLEQRIEALPAGGDWLAVLGIIFLVLIVLEVFNVTNFIGTR
jgi:glutathione S-transferase